MISGCIGWNGVRILSEVEGRMDAEQYVAILEEGMLQSMKESGIPEDDIIFQQDNDSIPAILLWLYQWYLM